MGVQNYSKLDDLAKTDKIATNKLCEELIEDSKVPIPNLADDACIDEVFNQISSDKGAK